MQLEHPPNPTMIDGNLIAGLDNPREFTGGEGVGQGQADNLVLDGEWHTRGDGRLAAPMREGPVIEEAHEAGALKPPQILPQLMIRDARRLALLDKRDLPLEDGAQPVVAR